MKEMEEELKGGQKKLDKNKNGKIDAEDFKLLRNKDVKKEGEDHEVSMAQNSLESIIKSAMELKVKLGSSERNIPGWIQDHITNAENYIDQAAQGFHELSHDDQDTEENPLTLQSMMEVLLNQTSKASYNNTKVIK